MSEGEDWDEIRLDGDETRARRGEWRDAALFLSLFLLVGWLLFGWELGVNNNINNTNNNQGVVSKYGWLLAGTEEGQEDMESVLAQANWIGQFEKTTSSLGRSNIGEKNSQAPRMKDKIKKLKSG